MRGDVWGELVASNLGLQVLGLELAGSLHLRNLIVEGLHVGCAPGRNLSFKDVVDFFERFLYSLRISEKDVEGHSETEGAEDKIRLPLDVFKGRRDEKG